MVTFSEAITNKYFRNHNPDFQHNLIDIFLPKYSCFKVPQIVVLSGLKINGTGNLPNIKKYCKQIKQLDLSNNELNYWKEIINILKQTEKLEFLNISFNKLIGPISKTTHQLSELKCLVLNGTKLKWHILARLLELLPSLEELHLSCNGYGKVLIDITEHDAELAEPHFDYLTHKMNKPHKRLKTLYFRKNPTRSWTDICRFGRIFPSLESLVVSECPIAVIGSSKTFGRLIHLNLNDINANMWENVEHLAQFPNIRSLCVRRWPLWTKCGLTKQEIWRLLIIRLPAVEQLNGSPISTKDREEALNTCQ